MLKRLAHPSCPAQGCSGVACWVPRIAMSRGRSLVSSGRPRWLTPWSQLWARQREQQKSLFSTWAQGRSPARGADRPRSTQVMNTRDASLSDEKHVVNASNDVMSSAVEPSCHTLQTGCRKMIHGTYCNHYADQCQSQACVEMTLMHQFPCMVTHRPRWGP